MHASSATQWACSWRFKVPWLKTLAGADEAVKTDKQQRYFCARTCWCQRKWTWWQTWWSICLQESNVTTPTTEYRPHHWNKIGDVVEMRIQERKNNGKLLNVEISIQMLPVISRRNRWKNLTDQIRHRLQNVENPWISGFVFLIPNEGVLVVKSIMPSMTVFL